MNKKRFLILTIVLIMASSFAAWAAGNDDGSDVHSPSMSTETGEEPIQDMSAEEYHGAGDITGEEEPGATDEEDVQDEEDAEDVEAEDEEADADQAQDEPSVGGGLDSLKSLYEQYKFVVVGAAGLVAVIVISALIRRASRRDRYVGKH